MVSALTPRVFIEAAMVPYPAARGDLPPPQEDAPRSIKPKLPNDVRLRLGNFGFILGDRQEVHLLPTFCTVTTHRIRPSPSDFVSDPYVKGFHIPIIKDIVDVGDGPLNNVLIMGMWQMPTNLAAEALYIRHSLCHAIPNLVDPELQWRDCG